MLWVPVCRAVPVSAWGVVGMLAGLGPAARAAEAQVPRLVAEARAGSAIPVAVLADDTPRGGARPGASFGAGFAFAVRGGLYVHAGFSQHRFDCDAGCDDRGDLTATGFDLALRFAVDAGAVMPWFRAGALPYTVEGSRDEVQGGGRVSDHTWGFEAGAGINVVLTENVHLSPGFRYVTLDPEFGGETGPEVRGWIADVGLVWAF